MDDSIRQGRDPQWQRAFQDRLDQAAQARVRYAVRRGGRLADPNEAAVAAGWPIDTSACSVGTR